LLLDHLKKEQESRQLEEKVLSLESELTAIFIDNNKERQELQYALAQK
jgi:hypothetical protein